MEKIVVKNLYKAFDEAGVLKDVSFTVNDGEFLSILGPSGCGKTTILRILIGLEDADSGSIIKDGVDITPRDIWVLYSKTMLFLRICQF